MLYNYANDKDLVSKALEIDKTSGHTKALPEDDSHKPMN